LLKEIDRIEGETKLKGKLVIEKPDFQPDLYKTGKSVRKIVEIDDVGY
jgi:hypothetical protein